MAFCRNCGKEIDDKSVTCPICGAPVAAAPGQGQTDKKEAPAAAGVKMAEIGISIALFAALIYWSGLMGSIPVVPVLLAGYVLIKEKDQWLRAVALKVIAIMVCFGLLFGFINLLVYFKEVMVDIINMLLTTISLGTADRITGVFFTDILNILTYIVLFIRDLFLILSGFKALKYRNLRIPVIDDLVNRHIGRMSITGR